MDGRLGLAQSKVLAERPLDQAPVLEGLPEDDRGMGHHRLYFQVVINKVSGASGATIPGVDLVRT